MNDGRLVDLVFSFPLLFLLMLLELLSNMHSFFATRLVYRGGRLEYRIYVF